MKKFVCASFIFLTMWMFGLSNASAQVLSWDSLCDKYIELYGDAQVDSGDGKGLKITKTSNSLSIDLNNDELSYNIKFNYKDNVVSYINDRDYDSMQFDARFMYSFIDSLLFQEVTTSILDSYNLDTDDLTLLEETGAVKIVTTSSIEATNFLDLPPEDVKEIYIDLGKVDQYIYGGSNNVIESEVVAPSLKASNNTMKSTAVDEDEPNQSLDNNASNEESNSNSNDVVSNPSETNPETTNSKITNQGITNPKTLDINSGKYLLFIGVSFIGIIGLMLNFAKNKRFNN